MRWLIGVAVVLASHNAVAQAPGERSAHEPPPPQELPEKTLLGAYLTTVAATSGPVLVGMAVTGFDDNPDGVRGAIGGSLALGGFLLGPSAGAWYAGEGFLTTGLILRVSGIGAAVAFMAAADSTEGDPAGYYVGAFMAGGGLIATGLVWDAVTAVKGVRRHQRERRRALTPMITGNTVGFAGSF
jgi:hypothetical protein